jgi:hypothetical protein
MPDVDYGALRSAQNRPYVSFSSVRESTRPESSGIAARNVPPLQLLPLCGVTLWFRKQKQAT